MVHSGQVLLEPLDLGFVVSNMSMEMSAPLLQLLRLAWCWRWDTDICAAELAVDKDICDCHYWSHSDYITILCDRRSDVGSLGDYDGRLDGDSSSPRLASLCVSYKACLNGCSCWSRRDNRSRGCDGS